MQRRVILLLTFALALSACGRSEKAQQELARRGINFNEMDFLENACSGNAGTVKLFLDAGMDREVKTRDGQTALMVARSQTRLTS